MIGQKLPPKAWRGHIFHWIGSEHSSTPRLVEFRDGVYYSPGESGPITPDEMIRRGWFWWAPAIPPGNWRGIDMNGREV